MSRARVRRLGLALLGAVVGFAVYYAVPAGATTTQTGTCTQNMVQIAPNAGTSLATNLDFTIPTDDYVVLQSFRFNVFTNSTAGARQVTLAVLDASGNELWLDPAPTTQAATLTRTYVAQSGHESFAINGSVIGLRLPEFPLVAGWKFRVKATGIGADVISFGWLGYCNSLDNSMFPVAVHTPSGPIRVQVETVTPIDVNVSGTVPVSGTVGLSSNHFLLDTDPVNVACASGCSGSTGTTIPPTTTTADATLVGLIETHADGTGEWMSSDALPAFTGWALAVLGGLGICLVSYKLLRRAA